MMLAELTADILPPGVSRRRAGPGRTVGQAIAANPRIAKVSFTGETVTGKAIMHAAADHLIPQTMELGGKSPNIFMADVLDEEDAFFDKALEGFTLFAFNKGEVCTCPSRALIHESIFDRFMERAVARVAAIRQGDPLDPATQLGAQASEDQLRKILGYIEIGKNEGAQCLIGGARALPGGELDGGYFVQPTVFVGDNSMRIFQEEIFGPVLSVTTFKTLDEAIAIANDTPYGLAPAPGAAAATPPIASAAPSRPDGSGPTAITSIRPTPPSAATRPRGSGARPTRRCSITTSRPRTCSSPTTSMASVCFDPSQRSNSHGQDHEGGRRAQIRGAAGHRGSADPHGRSRTNPGEDRRHRRSPTAHREAETAKAHRG